MCLHIYAFQIADPVVIAKRKINLDLFGNKYVFLIILSKIA